MSDTTHTNGELHHADIRFEKRDVNIAVVAKFGIALGVLALVVHTGIWFLLRALDDHEAQAKKSVYPLAVSERASQADLPVQKRLTEQLHGQPPLEEVERRAHVKDHNDASSLRDPAPSATEMEQYEWVDKEQKSVRVPMRQAMKEALQKKDYLKARPAGGKP